LQEPVAVLAKAGEADVALALKCTSPALLAELVEDAKALLCL
jgi:hypothetical protein